MLQNSSSGAGPMNVTVFRHENSQIVFGISNTQLDYIKINKKEKLFL
jgi:hypothetical protein